MKKLALVLWLILTLAAGSYAQNEQKDLDGSYVLTESTLESSEKVKSFDKFFEDLKKLKG
ncbi:MAG: hypothetical protein LBP51_08075 [Deferribacteraceae bacterium]|jgi:hypothetical protein|nr:hypothetical protein [Deferribacteraceae bacterium]